MANHSRDDNHVKTGPTRVRDRHGERRLSTAHALGVDAELPAPTISVDATIAGDRCPPTVSFESLGPFRLNGVLCRLSVA